MLRIGLIALACCSAASVEAKIYSLNLTPTVNQKSRYDRGVETIDSLKNASVIRVVEVAGTDKKSVSFVVGILNNSGQSLTFGPDNIVIRPAGMQPVNLVTYEQAAEAERKKQKKEKFWAGVAAFGRNMSAADAGTSYGTGFYNGTANGFVGSTPVMANTTGTYSYSVDNPAARVAAQRNANEMNRQDRSDLEARWATRASAQNDMLRLSTVDPGKVYGGFANFIVTDEMRKSKSPLQITIEINVNGERHFFLGQLTSAE